MSVTFEKGATSLTLPGPAPGSQPRQVKRQALGRAAGGQVYAYDKGVTTYQLTLRFESLTDQEVSDLVSFFGDTALGVMNTFTYTDSRGTSYTARFLQPEVSLTKVAQNVWDVELLLELNQMAG